MLQFWKKSGPRDKKVQINSTPERTTPEKQKTPPPLTLLKDEGLFDIDEYESGRCRSSLSKTLLEVLQDKRPLAYFTQYMESRGASRFLTCYLDIDAFKAETKTPAVSPVPKPDHDSLSVSTDSFTGDSTSLCDSCETPPGDSSHAITSTALTIFKKYIALEAVSGVEIPDVLRNEVVEKVCDQSALLTGTVFDKVHDYVLGVMDKEFFGGFTRSDFYSKHQIDVLTSGEVSLYDILYSETALFYFMEFLELEGGRPLLEFWIAASNLQTQLRDQKGFFDGAEAQGDAVVLYDKYFSLQALCPLGFCDRVRFAVEQDICGEEGLDVDCFQVPLAIVEHALERHHLKNFLASQLFYKYLSELINTVQANGYAMHLEGGVKASPSECGSSEKSFSTFLALEINQNANRKKKSDMSIDTWLLCDPDSLWKRKRAPSLSCGRVTALGKFITDLEPEPDRHNFRLKDVVRKFVSLEEDDKKENMAWQVAEMIVKDITSVTLREEA